MQSGIRCMLMRGGTSKGAYFLAEDLPADVRERDGLLLRIMGSPDPRQIDGIGGAHPLTSKVAIVSRSSSSDADIDFLFAQVSVSEGLVDTTPNCGNILAGVGPFAIERGLVPIAGPETRVRVRTLNTDTLAELVISTPNGVVRYEGDEAIDGVPGTAAPIPTNYLNTAGSVCGALFPTGLRAESINGIEVTCIDNGMPVVLMRATDLGFSGRESCPKLEAAIEPLAKIEAIRLDAGRRMGLGDVKEAVVPKMCLVSEPTDGCSINTRMFIPKKCHTSIGVFAAVTVATACVLPGTVAHAPAVVPEGRVKLLEIEHPTGTLQVRLEVGGSKENPTVDRAGLIRTARALFDGVVFPRESRPSRTDIGAGP
jgi:4-oxalomesaconate tautomerase